MTNVSATAPRLHNLDYLRGLAAFGIMIYHYLTWSVGAFPAETFLGRVGLYGVAIFYVLSGLTLFHVYFDKMNNLADVRAFFVRRVFRIFPLLWLVTITAVMLSRELPNLIDLFLNLTGLFGFVKWDTYFSAGVWSIGNELVFYVLFPLIVLCAKTSRSLFVLAGAALLAPYVYFAFWGMSADASMAEQWSTYINPLNQAFLFFGGVAIGWASRRLLIPRTLAWGTLIIAVALFVLWPANGEPSTLVTGLNRLVFTLICFAICASVYKITASLPRALHVPLSRLGEASYSVYLIHPLTYLVLTAAFRDRLPARALIAVAIATTLVLSWLCYRYFEQYFIQLGRRVARRERVNSAGSQVGL